MREDILTGFLSREELVPYLNKLIHEGKKFTLLLIDLDGFKKFNDKYGHLFGDEILRYIASTIKLTLFPGGKVFRYGGDEFIIVLPGRDKKQAFELAKLCNKHLRKRPFSYGGKLFKLTASHGIAAYPQDAKDPKTLIDMADKAMYFSKKRGRGLVSDVAKIGSIKLANFILNISFLTALIAGTTYILLHLDEYRYEKVVSKLGLRKYASPYIRRIKLRNGMVLKGRVVYSGKGKVVIAVKVDGEEGKIIIDKNLILEIR